MQFNSTIVSLIILLVIFGPVGYLIIKSSGKDAKIKKKLLKFAKNKGAIPTEIEIIGNLVIGLDEINKKLVFTNKNNLDYDLKIIDISTLSGIRTKTISSKNESLDWVGLELSNHTEKEEIEFYNDQDDSGPILEPLATKQNALRWEKRISSLMV